jgi:hydrogenase nickel incorporation protein HypB
MFRAADLALITKTDLLAVLDDFDPVVAETHLRNLASEAPLICLSSRSGEGLDQWLTWLRQQVASHRDRVASGNSRRPAIQEDGVHLHEHGTASA